MNRLLVLTAAFLLVVLGALLGGALTRTHSASASSTHVYTLRLGDKVSIPGIGQACSVEKEATLLNLFCSKGVRAHHQVVIFRNNMLVYKVGDPDHVAWAGKP